MRVLVTGAGGFLGGHLLARLAARGDTAVALDRAHPRPLPGGAEPVVADVTDRAAVARAARGCDAVIHAAALTGLWARDPADFERVNVGGTRIVLEAAAEAGATRAVHVSSFTTLIAGDRRAPFRVVAEDDRPPEAAMLGAYPRSKWRAEEVAAAAPVPAAIVLPTAPVGPGDAVPTPPGALLRDLANGVLPAMIDCSWNLIDVRAVADAALAALERGRPGRRYLLAGEDLTTTELLARIHAVAGIPVPRARAPYPVALLAAHVEGAIAALTGRAPRAPLTGVRLAGPRLGFDASRARAELGFAPPPTDDALRDAFLWMREAGWLTRPLPGLDRRDQ